ncbi:hypothetical protein [Nocardia sp. NBC_01329]|uniref:hypothetical protein n=1 Tax=Nocardia sp. NBC_01329 TaxID=2903594 RepID=UPI002E14AFA4|nr:hypothetical protein OG405_00505 [Nocardia sp. NBC_01329]
MVDTVRIQLIGPGLWSIAPAGSPDPAAADPGPDTAVLEVGGGHLSWSLLAEHRVPAAILHDLDSAQEWLWALYGAEVAVAADDYTEPVELPIRPERPELAAAVRRLGYAHWAARWWPASTVDGIPALDPAELDREIAELSEYCESVVDGADAPGEADAPDALAALAPDLGRAVDYALAAGGQPRDSGTALIVERGSSGWDWRHCPPGVVDASERAVSWELVRAAGANTLRVRVVAAPGLHGDLPEYLRPRALVRTPAGVHDAALVSTGDTWTAAVADSDGAVSAIEIYVPGVGPSPPEGAVSPDLDSDAAQGVRHTDPAAEARRRDLIRDLARARLHRAGHTVAYAVAEPAAGPADIELLRAEITAAETDSDF